MPRSKPFGSINKTRLSPRKPSRRSRMSGVGQFAGNKVTGAALTEEIFGLYDYDDMTEELYETAYDAGEDALTTDEPSQLELPLECKEELEYELRRLISRYRRSLERMGDYALRWHYLMEDVENSGQVEKMFNDLQFVRKLAGGGDKHI